MSFQQLMQNMVDADLEILESGDEMPNIVEFTTVRYKYLLTIAMNSDTKIQFGTDGWRCQIANDYTFDNVRRCAQGYAIHMLEQGHAGESIVVGYAKSYASEHFARAVAEVLSAN